jgi:hypothetical protein
MRTMGRCSDGGGWWRRSMATCRCGGGGWGRLVKAGDGGGGRLWRGGMVTMYFVERQVGRSPFGSKKWSTELTTRIPTQKSKDASRTQNPPFASYLRPSEGKTSKDASRMEEKTQKKIAKYPIGRTQLASVRTKPTLVQERVSS